MDVAGGPLHLRVVLGISDGDGCFLSGSSFWEKQGVRLVSGRWQRRVERFVQGLGFAQVAPGQWQAVYDEARVKATMRLYYSSSADARAVLHGGALSEAVYGVMQCGAAPLTCSYCGQRQVPTSEYLVWECDHFAEARPAVPPDLLALRLGWPAPGEDAREQLAFMTKLRRTFLDRHGHHVPRGEARIQLVKLAGAEALSSPVFW